LKIEILAYRNSIVEKSLLLRDVISESSLKGCSQMMFNEKWDFGSGRSLFMGEGGSQIL